MSKKILTVRKTKQAQAVQINSPEEEAVVKGWLEQMGAYQPELLEELKKKKFWFLRDMGDVVVYVSHPADFLNDYEEVGEEDIVGSPITEVSIDKFSSEFTFGND